MIKSSRFASRVFLIAAIYGVIVLAPQYFLESQMNPPTNYPEHFYGFVGLALVWQFAFILISRDVVRYRFLMPIAVLEKLVFGIPAVVLFLLDRVVFAVLAFGMIDLLLGILFLISFFLTSKIKGGVE